MLEQTGNRYDKGIRDGNTGSLFSLLLDTVVNWQNIRIL
jgi:hypothetical protein